MDADEAYRAMAAALRQQHLADEQRDRDLSLLLVVVGRLVDLLVERGALEAEDRRLLARLGERAAASVWPDVRLGPAAGKRELPGLEIDCQARLPLCHARCCFFSFALGAEDLEEGRVRWDVEQPYLIRRRADGSCFHLDQQVCVCTVYEDRPFACRAFDCRDDPRIWTDFERRIPAPRET
jgi:Fe-S-cluster containining protein